MKQTFEKNPLSILAVEKRGFRGFPMMFHPHIEILCVLEGSVRVNVDSADRELRAGELCAVFPYVMHSYEDAPDAVFRLILVSPQSLSVLGRLILETKPGNPFLNMTPTWELLTKQAVENMALGSDLGEKTACGYTAALVGEILMRSEPVPIKTDKASAIRNLVIYCNEHFTEDISIQTAADTCFISKSFVSKIFAREIGCSFPAYINELRIRYARDLLRKTDMKITDIMDACGFKNQSSFNRVFFEQCRQTPRQFRSSNR